eukprot:1493885-Rhodomonas_salina.1
MLYQVWAVFRGPSQRLHIVGVGPRSSLKATDPKHFLSLSLYLLTCELPLSSLSRVVTCPACTKEEDRRYSQDLLLSVEFVTDQPAQNGGDGAKDHPGQGTSPGKVSTPLHAPL